jgi:hypothetical protein
MHRSTHATSRFAGLHEAKVTVWAFAFYVLTTGHTARALPEPRLERLVGIDSVSLAIIPFPGPTMDASCKVAEAPLEQRGLEMLRAAGLRGFGRADEAAITRRNGELMQRGMQALREGRAPAGPNSEEGRLRHEGIEFINNLPLMAVTIATSLVEVGGERVCALTAHAVLTVRAPLGATVPGTGRMFIGGLQLWDRRARTFSSAEADIQALAAERVEDIVTRFIATWREANRR